MMSVTKNNINSVLATDKLVVLLFSNPTCGPCKDVKIILAHTESTIKNAVFAMCDTHDNTDLVGTYNIKSVPTIVFIKNNRITNRATGLVESNKLISTIKSVVRT
jgi:thiol-disulfide isomerase/thioredoxin